MAGVALKPILKNLYKKYKTDALKHFDEYRVGEPESWEEYRNKLIADMEEFYESMPKVYDVPTFIRKAACSAAACGSTGCAVGVAIGTINGTFSALLGGVVGVVVGLSACAVFGIVFICCRR